MDPVISFIVFAVFTERLVEIFIALFPVLNSEKVKKFGERWISVKLGLAIVFSSIFSFGSGLSIFAIFNMRFDWAYFGEGFAAFFMIMGSQAVHELIGKVYSAKQQEEA